MDTSSTEFVKALALVAWACFSRTQQHIMAKHIIAYCRRMSLSVDQVVVEIHDGFRWNTKTYSPWKAKAKIIGKVKVLKSSPETLLWVLPKPENYL